MPFAEDIRIIKFAKPRVDVIISDTLASVVFFDEDTGARGMDYTSRRPIDRPPSALLNVALTALARAVVDETVPPGPREIVCITDGTGKVLTDYQPALLKIPMITVKGTDVLIDGRVPTDAEVKRYATEIAKAAGVTLISSEADDEPGPRSKFNPINAAPKKKRVLPQFSDLKIVAETAIPEPDTKARGKVVIHRLIPITDSSIIAHVGYDDRTCTLEVGIIKFFVKPTMTKRKAKTPAKKVGTKSMRIIRYRYKDVPKEILVGILTAESAGTYFNVMVKPHYIGRRVP